MYRVLNEEDIRNRFEISVARGLTPLVGREETLAVLFQAWKRAKTGAGQVVLLKGEAGIGKSRLVQSLKDRLKSETYLRLEYHCSPYHQHSALYPIIDWLQRALGFSREDSAEQQLQKLDNALKDPENGFAFPDMEPKEVQSLLASLLSLPVPENSWLSRLSPQRQKQKTLALLLQWIIARAATQPVLVVVEDLHWADPSSLEFLSLMVAQQSTARILTVLTFRPNFVPPWPLNGFCTVVTPSRLSREHVETMVNSLAGEKALPPQVIDQIVLRTDGIPLFVEELTKSTLESGFLREKAGRYEFSGMLPSFAIPTTLQGSLMARLDRLGAVKELAQLAAVVGREFSYELLQTLVTDESVLQRGLRQLTDAELVYHQGTPPQARYFFKHALVQDAAYQSLLKGRRKQLHSHLAQVLEERFPEIVEDRPELLAHHYAQAERPLQAIPYWRQAGKIASDRAAHIEAIQHFSSALDCALRLPDSLDRDQLELGIQVSLGLSLAAGKGYAALEVERTYNRARELCSRLGETTEIFPILRGLCTFYMVRDDQSTARSLAEQCLRVAQDSGNPAYLIESYTALGYCLCYLGELTISRILLEEAVTHYEEQKGSALPLLTPQDPGVACLSLLSCVVWLLGYPEQSLRYSQRALALARRLEHPFHLGYAHLYCALLHVFRHEPEQAEHHGQAMVRIGTEYGLDLLTILGSPYVGIAKAWQGEPLVGIEMLTQALAMWRAIGVELNRIYPLSGLAQAYQAAHQYERAFATVNEALAHVEQHGEYFYQAALLHMRGELFHTQPTADLAAAEADFQQAIALARKQETKLLELRATMGLSRIWHAQGKTEHARMLLREVYGWFTEGFDTKDLTEARSLLAELV